MKKTLINLKPGIPVNFEHCSAGVRWADRAVDYDASMGDLRWAAAARQPRHLATRLCALTYPPHDDPLASTPARYGDGAPLLAACP